MKTIGILGIQGAMEAHAAVIQKLGYPTVFVKTLPELQSIDGLIIPGGESTTMGKQLSWFNLLEPLRQRILDGMPVFGTCAGMILLAKDIVGSDQLRIGTMNISVERNAYGRQIASFFTRLPVKGSPHDVEAAFIRAPRISQLGEGVEVLSSYEGHPVLVREKNMLAASFHPELTDDTYIHELFIGMLS